MRHTAQFRVSEGSATLFSEAIISPPPPACRFSYRKLSRAFIHALRLCRLLHRFNREGDLFVSCAKDLSPSLWRSEDGTRVGTFIGHNGTVWTCDMTCAHTSSSPRIHTQLLSTAHRGPPPFPACSEAHLQSRGTDFSPGPRKLLLASSDIAAGSGCGCGCVGAAFLGAPDGRKPICSADNSYRAGHPPGAWNFPWKVRRAAAPSPKAAAAALGS